MKSRLFKKLLKINDLNKSIPFEKGFSREEGIRTPDTLLYTRFPSVRLKPLGHLSKQAKSKYFFSKFRPFLKVPSWAKLCNLNQ